MEQNGKDAFEKYFEDTFKMSVTKYNEENSQTLFYSTGILSLDIASGIGGFPQGRIIEIYGPESGGKSLIALQAIAHAQKKYKLPSLYLDLEGSTPPDWLKTVGVDLDMLTIISPDAELYAERALDLVISAAEADVYAYIVVDSVVGLVPEKEMMGSIEDNSIGLISRRMAQALRKLTPVLGASKTCAVFINQIRDKVGVFGMRGLETTPGGRALKFYAAQRYRTTKKTEIKDSSKVICGHVVNIKNKKNKLGPPQREGEFSINYTTGVDKIDNLIKIARQYNLIEKNGQFLNFSYIYSNEQNEVTIKERGVQKFKDALKLDSEAQDKLYSLCLDTFLSGKANITGISSEDEDEFDS